MKRLIYLLAILAIFTSCSKETKVAMYKEFNFQTPYNLPYPVIYQNRCVSCFFNEIAGEDSLDFRIRDIGNTTQYIDYMVLSYKEYSNRSTRVYYTLTDTGFVNPQYLRAYLDSVKVLLSSNPSDYLQVLLSDDYQDCSPGCKTQHIDSMIAVSYTPYYAVNQNRLYYELDFWNLNKGNLNGRFYTVNTNNGGLSLTRVHTYTKNLEFHTYRD